MTQQGTQEKFELPPSVHLKMALDFLYARAIQLDMQDTALLIGSAALSAEQEGLAQNGGRDKKQGQT